MNLGQRTPVTTLLLIAIVAVFVVESLSGGSTDAQVLLRFGANQAERVFAGEYWRLFASMFLHIGIPHLLLNGWALYQLGSLFEVWLGSGRLLGAYVASGLAGSLASVLWSQFGSSPNPERLSAGASGAIFGLLGALIAFLLRRRSRLRPQAKSLLYQLLFWAGLNVFLGLRYPEIDNAAHMGGLAAGLVIGLLLREQEYRPSPLPPPPDLSGGGQGAI
ncbi:MAG TPA: rhomboid family intramembrane serine protease [Thermoanaerobaculia bacterium]|nr:rhomboid family intramembrane serine protease [Thermoanaerobaculia bacterium]